MQGEEIKISQFANDPTIILDGSKESFTAALQDLKQFGSISGLRLNDKKTEVLWIGSKAGCNEVFCPGKNLKWVNKVKSLGVWISTDSEASIKANYDEKIEKAQNVLSYRTEIPETESVRENNCVEEPCCISICLYSGSPAIKSYSLR